MEGKNHQAYMKTRDFLVAPGKSHSVAARSDSANAKTAMLMSHELSWRSSHAIYSFDIQDKDVLMALWVHPTGIARHGSIRSLSTHENELSAPSAPQSVNCSCHEHRHESMPGW
jgi:hypothetical protein